MTPSETSSTSGSFAFATDFTIALDWSQMAMPAFTTTVARTDDHGRPVETFVVVTFGDDFQAVAGGWESASDDERPAMFWSLGTVHIVETEICRLPPQARQEVVDRIQALDRRDPRGLATRMAQILREAPDRDAAATTVSGLTAAEMAVYRRMLIIRATAPYAGHADANFVRIQAGVLPP